MAAGYSPPRRRRAERGSGVAMSPVKARGVWRALCVAVRAAAARPDEPPMSLVDPLRQAPKGSFPLPAGDARRAWADDFRGAVERWRVTPGYEVRRMFAPGLAAQAACLTDLLIALGAEEATAGRARMGFRDED